MRKAIILIAVMGLLLSGCGNWMDGRYVSVKPHTDKQQQLQQEVVVVSTYTQMRDALVSMVEGGLQSGTLSVEAFEEQAAKHNMDMAIEDVTQNNPIGAYAVSAITYEQGISGVTHAIAVTIQYNNNLAQLRSIKNADSMEEAKGLITAALAQLHSGVLIRVPDYEKVDYEQLLQDYADANPDLVIEVPGVTANTFPYEGADRVVEVKFTYQGNRENMRGMKEQVADVFDSARLYVSGEGEPLEKYAQLYSFLNERFAYQYDTSITPSYSLLCHGVGDSRAFAVVYAAMCREAGLPCEVVAGTRDGAPWFWNIICDNDIYYHVDLAHEQNFVMFSDAQMEGCVWDYSAYPVCGVQETAVEETTAETESE